MGFNSGFKGLNIHSVGRCSVHINGMRMVRQTDRQQTVIIGYEGIQIIVRGAQVSMEDAICQT
jgi:hypothetical protein